MLNTNKPYPVQFRNFNTFTLHTLLYSCFLFYRYRNFRTFTSLRPVQFSCFLFYRYRNFRTFTSPRPVQFSCFLFYRYRNFRTFTSLRPVQFSCFLFYRYRNFRTFTSPRPVQFSCLTVDNSGEIVCAGGLDVFEIFVWSMQTGRLLEVIVKRLFWSRHVRRPSIHMSACHELFTFSSSSSEPLHSKSSNLLQIFL